MSDTPDIIKQWMEITQSLIGAAAGYAAGDPEHQREGVQADIVRMRVMANALTAALQVAANAPRPIPPAPPPTEPETEH